MRVPSVSRRSLPAWPLVGSLSLHCPRCTSSPERTRGWTLLGRFRVHRAGAVLRPARDAVPVLPVLMAKSRVIASAGKAIIFEVRSIRRLPRIAPRSMLWPSDHCLDRPLVARLSPRSRSTRSWQHAAIDPGAEAGDPRRLQWALFAPLRDHRTGDRTCLASMAASRLGLASTTCSRAGNHMLHRGDIVYMPMEEAQYIRTRLRPMSGPTQRSCSVTIGALWLRCRQTDGSPAYSHSICASRLWHRPRPYCWRLTSMTPVLMSPAR